MNNKFRCGDDQHEGDRSQIHYTDRLEERVELRRLSDYGRERVIKLSDICKACARRKYPRQATDATIAMFPSTPSLPLSGSLTNAHQNLVSDGDTP